MPYPADVMRCEMRFSLEENGQALESGLFSFGMFHNHFTGSEFDWQDGVNRVATAMHDNWLSNVPTTRFSAAVRMVEARCVHVNPNGSTAHRGTKTFEETDWHGSEDTGLPWECALVVTLYGWDRTVFNPKQRQQRGRFYLPPLGVSQIAGGAGGKITSAGRDALTGNIGDFLNAMQGTHMNGNSAPAEDYASLCVISLEATEHHQVESISIGNVIDSQRRRRKNQVEQRAYDGIDFS